MAPFHFKLSTYLVEGQYYLIVWIYARKRLVDTAYVVVSTLDVLNISHRSVEKKIFQLYDQQSAVRWQKGVSENFDFLDFIICGVFRGRSFHLSNSHSCKMFIFQDSRGYLQHFFEFCSTICWQKGVSDRYTLRQFLRLWQKGVCDRYALYELRVSAA